MTLIMSIFKFMKLFCSDKMAKRRLWSTYDLARESCAAAIIVWSWCVCRRSIPESSESGHETPVKPYHQMYWHRKWHHIECWQCDCLSEFTMYVSVDVRKAKRKRCKTYLRSSGWRTPISWIVLTVLEALCLLWIAFFPVARSSSVGHGWFVYFRRSSLWIHISEDFGWRQGLLWGRVNVFHAVLSDYIHEIHCKQGPIGSSPFSVGF